MQNKCLLIQKKRIYFFLQYFCMNILYIYIIFLITNLLLPHILKKP